MKRLTMLKLLVDKGADVNHATKDIKMSALHWAAFNGDDMLVSYLLHHGAEFSTSYHGHTSIDIAGLCRHSNVVDTLTAHLMKICKPIGKEEL
jgi:ankyrin repeat protein